MWLCRFNQKNIRKTNEDGLTTKADVATTIQLVEEISTKKTCRIRENHTKATKEVVLRIEEEVVVENLTRVTFNVSVLDWARQAQKHCKGPVQMDLQGSRRPKSTIVPDA